MRNVNPKGALALIVLLLLALVGVGGAQSTPVWEPAVEIESTSAQTFGRATSISCVTDDDCVMVGFLGFNPSVAVATEKVDGTWGELGENPGLSEVDLPDWDPAASVSLSQVSCLDSGECVSGGSLGLQTGGATGFVTTRTGGTWSAETIPGLVELSTDTGATPNAGVNSVSCDDTGLCVAGGVYRYGAANNLFGGWVSTRTGGTWSTAIPVPGLPALNVRDNAQVVKVTCPGGGGCVVIGTYSADVGGVSRGQAFIAEFSSGTWDDAFPVPGLVPPGGVNQGSASFEGLGCATFDDCAAGGRYWNGSAFQGFVVDKTGGTWGQVTDVPGFAPAANVGIQHIACPVAGACAMTAHNFTTNTGYLVSQSGGVWQNAEQLVFADGLDAVINAMRGISCSGPGDCAAVGIYRTSNFSTFQAWQATQTDGVWTEADSIPGMAELLVDPPSRSHGEAVDCVADGGCNFGGVTFFGGAPHRFFAAARVTPPPPPTTTTTVPETTTTTSPEPTTSTTVPADEGIALEVDFEVGEDIRLGEASVEASGTGLAPFADFRVVFRSEPQIIGATVTGEAGDASVDAVVPADAAPGAHSLSAESLDRNGDFVSDTVWFTIGSDGIVEAISDIEPTPPPAEVPASGGSTLPATGFVLGGLVVVAAGFLTGGAAMVANGRRRPD